MKVITFTGFWTIDDTKKYSDFIFIFGDNNIRTGCKGQAIIRYEPNAYGIPTKKYPNNSLISFYNDNEYNDNVKRIDTAINNVIAALSNKKNNYIGIILPENGLGTGLADLPNKAPKTYNYLENAIKRLTKYVIDY